MIIFCTICFHVSLTDNNNEKREGRNCKRCKSTARDRQVAYQLHKKVLGRLLKNPLREIKIIGISDGYLLAKSISKIYGSWYVNYNYTAEPKLDIKNIPREKFGTADFIICSEVLEHVSPPVSEAFEGLYKLLRENGVLILSVPHGDQYSNHLEHYPINLAYALDETDPLKLIGTDERGDNFVFDNLTFHGGEGFTVEFRVFSERSLIENLKTAGFSTWASVKNNRIIGAVWEPWSRVWRIDKN